MLWILETLLFELDYYIPFTVNLFINELYEVINELRGTLALKQKRDIGPAAHHKYINNIKNYKNRENFIISAMKKAHPYEEVAYQIYILDNIYENVGSGIIGDLPQEIDANQFLEIIKNKMQTDCIRHSNLVKNQIKRVAICGGSGSFLLSKAICAKADIFITADFKYHEFFDAENDIIIADIGHFESEQFTKDLIYDLLRKKFSKFAVRLSKVNTNPINYL